VEHLADLPSVVAAVLERATAPTLLLGVEGTSQSGKSRLASDLAPHLDAHVIRTDDYYKQGVLGERYQEGLRKQDLRREILRHRTSGDNIIVEGICLRDTLDSLEVAADLFIYCKHISSAGIWHGDPDFSDPDDFDLTFTQGRIDWWSYQYHKRLAPHMCADIVYEWRGDAL
jgi:hypothetical protein